MFTVNYFKVHLDASLSILKRKTRRPSYRTYANKPIVAFTPNGSHVCMY